MSNSPNKPDEDQFDDLARDLTCPISQDLFSDPVMVPCCTKAFERLSLIQHFQHNTPCCPLCRKELVDFNPATAPKNLIIVSMVESYMKLIKGKEKKEPSPPKQPEEKWCASLTPLYDKSKVLLPVAQLKLELENAKFVPKPSLFIAVVDHIWKHGWHPFQQVQSALLHIASLTHGNPFLKLVLIAYDSSAEIINLGVTQADNFRVIKSMVAGGGTVFKAAFNKIREVLTTYQPENIGNVVITLLTDGQDNGSGNGCTADDKNKLVLECDEMLKKSWRGPLSFHSIGFGRECDKDLLEGLRKIGQSGTFRYAEPEDNTDALCGKITGLFDIVSKSATVPLRLKLDKMNFHSNKQSTLDIQFPVNEHKTGEYCCWTLLNSLDDPGTLKLYSDKDEATTIPIVLNPQPINLLQKWFAVVLDELAAETLDLSKQNKAEYGLDLFDLHCGLLEQKCDALNSQIDASNRERLDYIMQSIASLRAGLAVNIGKLSDLRFASQYLTVAPPPKPAPKVLLDVQSVPVIKAEKQWTEMSVYYNRNNKDKNRNALQEAIMNQ